MTDDVARRRIGEGASGLRRVAVWLVAVVAVVAAGMACRTGEPAGLSDACGVYAQSLCQRLASCSPLTVHAIYADVSACASRLGQACVTDSSAPGATTTAAGLRVCAGVLDGVACGSLMNHDLPADCRLPPGMLADGEGCGADGQCASTRCARAAGEGCGACAKVAREGQACTAESDCDYGLTCGTGGTCVRFGARGSTCDAAHPCGYELGCVSGACAPVAAPGQACDPKQNDCDLWRAQSCDPSTSTCGALRIAGAGQACGETAAGLVVCGAAASCRETDTAGVCVAPSGDGAACDEAQAKRCIAPARCVDGSCRWVDPARCPSNPGSPGTGRDGGSSGSSDAGSGDAGPSDGGAGDAGPSTADACAAYAKSLCQRLQACSPLSVTATYADVATCTSRLAAACVTGASAPGTATTAAGLVLCAGVLDGVDCASLMNHGLPDSCRLPPGARADGTACGADGQCASTRCARDGGASCGACAKLAASGQACVAESDCDYGLECVSGACVAFGAQGATCDANHPCGYGLDCVSGACAPVVASGQPCDTQQNNCDLLHEQSCDPSTAMCGPLSLADAGGACGVTSTGLVLCNGAGSCRSSDSVCVAPSADGQPCDPSKSEQCMAPSRCVGGTCQRDAPAGCQ
jgi:hypothetical protein